MRFLEEADALRVDVIRCQPCFSHEATGHNDLTLFQVLLLIRKVSQLTAGEQISL